MGQHVIGQPKAEVDHQTAYRTIKGFILIEKFEVMINIQMQKQRKAEGRDLNEKKKNTIG